MIKVFNSISDRGPFLDVPFDNKEIYKAVNRLHKRKACGYDEISAEHVIYAGEAMVNFLTRLFNKVAEIEYMPSNFRRGVQVPLFKGKILCSLDTNNYRGITLLTSFNKIFEIAIWHRIEKWWFKSGIISRFQGACRKGQSCIHTAVLLQETVSVARETNNSVFVSYFDVLKAFDTVWTNGLFYKLYNAGITGKIWRLLYRAYEGFTCSVRIENKTYDQYVMQCGIHQGGFLSLMKYSVFINGLLEELEASKLCCSIYHIPSTPAGYADDLATATTSKAKTDRVHDIAYS